MQTNFRGYFADSAASTDVVAITDTVGAVVAINQIVLAAQITPQSISALIDTNCITLPQAVAVEFLISNNVIAETQRNEIYQYIWAHGLFLANSVRSDMMSLIGSEIFTGSVEMESGIFFQFESIFQNAFALQRLPFVPGIV